MRKQLLLRQSLPVKTGMNMLAFLIKARVYNLTTKMSFFQKQTYICLAIQVKLILHDKNAQARRKFDKNVRSGVVQSMCKIQ